MRLLLTAAALAAAAAAAAPQEGATFDNWTVGCETVQDEKRTQCFIFQNLVLREGGQRVLHVAVGYLPDQHDPIALFTLPLGISLPPGASLQVDEGEPVRFPIERCEPEGCRAGLRLEDEVLAAFKKGEQVKVTFHDATRRPVSVPLSLKGFMAGLRALREDEGG